MKTRKLGTLDIESSEIGLGCAGISGEGKGYGFGKVSEEESIELVKEAYERGITLFDTAPIYGFNTSEIRLGKAIKDFREKVIVVSKSGIDWHENKRVNLTNDPKVTAKMFENSLKNLNTDYIDLYMIHWPDPEVDISYPLEVLEKFKSQGKIKNIGLCNTNLEDLEKAKKVTQINVVQAEFNLLKTQNKEDLFNYLKKENISFMSWGTLEKGIIPGTVTKKRENEKKYDEADCRKNAPWWNHKEVIGLIEKMEKVFPYLESINHNGLELALSYNLSHEVLSTCLCGSKSLTQLDDLLKAYNNPLSINELNEVTKIIHG